jgi:anaerobic selenocysteine-containing dehydrogenase
MGVVPKLKSAVFAELEKQYGVTLPTWAGLDTLGCLDAAQEGEIRFAFCLGGNLYGSNPDASYAKAAMAKIDLVVTLSTTLNTGHAVGLGKESLILPVLARDEEQQPTTQESMFNYVRISDGGEERLPGPRSEVSVISDMAARLFEEGSPIDWEGLREHGQIRKAIARVVPGYKELEDVDKTKKEFHIEGRTFHKPKFATNSGLARFHPIRLPKPPAGMQLITVRSEGQFNTVVYEEEDRYRGQDRRDIVMLCQADIDRLGFEVDQRVTVSSAIGSMKGQLVRAVDVRPGCAVMYFPEVNVIVPRAVDPKSQTPAFKSVAIEISAE